MSDVVVHVFRGLAVTSLVFAVICLIGLAADWAGNPSKYPRKRDTVIGGLMCCFLFLFFLIVVGLLFGW